MYLLKINTPYTILKRFMMTQSKPIPKSTDSPNLPELDPLVESNSSPIIEIDLVPSSLSTSNNPLPQIPPLDTASAIEKLLTPEQRWQAIHDANVQTKKIFDTIGNEFTNPATKSTPDTFTPVNNSLSKEALLTDIAMKSITANMESIATALEKNITKSEGLAKEWTSHISTLDTFIKSLSAWKRTIGYTVCLFTIGAFLWKMGVLRQIPHFLSNLISVIPTPSLNSSTVKEISKEIPKPSIPQTLLDTPLTPITILVGVGSISNSRPNFSTIIYHYLVYYKNLLTKMTIIFAIRYFDAVIDKKYSDINSIKYVITTTPSTLDIIPINKIAIENIMTSPLVCSKLFSDMVTLSWAIFFAGISTTHLDIYTIVS